MFRKGAWNGKTASTERSAECMILLAKKICQRNMKKRNRQTNRNARKLHDHDLNLVRQQLSFHTTNLLKTPANNLDLVNVLKFNKILGFPGIHADRS